MFVILWILAKLNSCKEGPAGLFCTALEAQLLPCPDSAVDGAALRTRCM